MHVHPIRCTGLTACLTALKAIRQQGGRPPEFRSFRILFPFPERAYFKTHETEEPT